MFAGNVPDDAVGDSVGGHSAVAGGGPHVSPHDVRQDLRPLPLQLRAHMYSYR